MNKYKHLKEKALKLRNQNRTLTEICEMLSLPKTTVYYWIQGTKIPRTQKQLLTDKKLINYGKSCAGFYASLRDEAWC